MEDPICDRACRGSAARGCRSDRGRCAARAGCRSDHFFTGRRHRSHRSTGARARHGSPARPYSPNRLGPAGRRRGCGLARSRDQRGAARRRRGLERGRTAERALSRGGQILLVDGARRVRPGGRGADADRQSERSLACRPRAVRAGQPGPHAYRDRYRRARRCRDGPHRSERPDGPVRRVRRPAHPDHGCHLRQIGCGLEAGPARPGKAAHGPRVYAPGREPQVLPQVLTPGLLRRLAEETASVAGQNVRRSA